MTNELGDDWEEELRGLNWIPAEETGSYYANCRGTLMFCPMMVGGSMAEIDQAGEVEVFDGIPSWVYQELWIEKGSGQMSIEDVAAAKAMLCNRLDVLASAVKSMVRLYESNEELNDLVNIQDLVPMSLDEWYLEIVTKREEIETELLRSEVETEAYKYQVKIKAAQQDLSATLEKALARFPEGQVPEARVALARYVLGYLGVSWGLKFGK